MPGAAISIQLLIGRARRGCLQAWHGNLRPACWARPVGVRCEKIPSNIVGHARQDPKSVVGRARHGPSQQCKLLHLSVPQTLHGHGLLDCVVKSLMKPSVGHAMAHRAQLGVPCTARRNSAELLKPHWLRLNTPHSPTHSVRVEHSLVECFQDCDMHHPSARDGWPTERGWACQARPFLFVFPCNQGKGAHGSENGKEVSQCFGNQEREKSPGKNAMLPKSHAKRRQDNSIDGPSAARSTCVQCGTVHAHTRCGQAWQESNSLREFFCPGCWARVPAMVRPTHQVAGRAPPGLAAQVVPAEAPGAVLLAGGFPGGASWSNGAFLRDQAQHAAWLAREAGGPARPFGAVPSAARGNADFVWRGESPFCPPTDGVHATVRGGIAQLIPAPLQSGPDAAPGGYSGFGGAGSAWPCPCLRPGCWPGQWGARAAWGPPARRGGR